MHKSEQLLSTKFYIPPARPELISRPRLLQQLNDGLHRKLTLISAPAGFGKTTLVSEWVEQLRPGKSQRIAWLSLDENDNEPTRFLSYFIHSLKQVDATEASLGGNALAMLRSSQAPSTEVILTSLINELVNNTDEIIFVLDDYHVIEIPVIDDALAFLLDHLPPTLHLVITSRVDPSIPLSRLRARGQVTELRTADLRFTLDEAAEFFQHISGLKLSSSEIAALESRTEGWIAGLQLAALSMQGREDIPEFISSFTGDHRDIVDYLVEEVVVRRSEGMRNVLLE
jgi:LuxR family maltose regulon positive regulatory protein